MHQPEAAELFGLVALTATMAMFLPVPNDLVEETKLNGPMIRALHGVFEATAFLLAWIWVGVLRGAIDFLAGLDLRGVLLSHTVGVPLAILFIA